jgi:hypothetical protein
MQNDELPEENMSDTTVHRALAAASQASRTTDKMNNFSVRLPENTKLAAQEICSRHCTDLGTYLRECAKALVADYGIPDQE